MDLRHFFDGQQSRENAASAFLATLLEYDPAFRGSFFEALGVPGLEADTDWAVRVEDVRPWSGETDGLQPVGSMDITLESPSTVVIIENKLFAGAKRDGQLLQYYEQASHAWAVRRIVMVYLSPHADLSTTERRLVAEGATYLARTSRGDAVTAITWKRVEELIETSSDAGWFASSGVRAVMTAIESAARGLPPDAQRKALRAIVRAATDVINERVAPTRFRTWPSRAAEDILPEASPVYVGLTVRFAVDPDTAALVDVVTEAGIRVSVRLTVGLSTTGKRDPRVVAAWDAIIASGSVPVDGVGTLPVRRRQLIDESPAELRTAGELTDMLVTRAEAAIRLLRPCLDAGRGSGPAA